MIGKARHCLSVWTWMRLSIKAYRYRPAHWGKSCWDFIRAAPVGYWWLGRIWKYIPCHLSPRAESQTLQRTRRFMRIWSWGVVQQAAQLRVVRHAAVWQTNSTAPSMQYVQIIWYRLVHAAYRIRLHFQTSHHRNLSPIFLQGWRHWPATSRSLGFWPPVRRRHDSR